MLSINNYDSMEQLNQNSQLSLRELDESMTRTEEILINKGMEDIAEMSRRILWAAIEVHAAKVRLEERR